GPRGRGRRDVARLGPVPVAVPRGLLDPIRQHRPIGLLYRGAGDHGPDALGHGGPIDAVCPPALVLAPDDILRLIPAPARRLPACQRRRWATDQFARLRLRPADPVGGLRLRPGYSRPPPPLPRDPPLPTRPAPPAPEGPSRRICADGRGMPRDVR